MTRATRTTAGLFALSIVIPMFAHAALVDINTADAALLDTLPGIGPSKAAAIVDYRAKNGLFATTTDIQKVSGIGPVTFAHMKMLITIGTTSTSSILEAVAPPQTSAQPSASGTSYHPVKAVEPITSPQKNIQAHEQAVIAPAAATEVAAAGATLPPPTLSVGVPTSDVGTASAAREIFKSPWILGLLGVVALAGGAFVFL